MRLSRSAMVMSVAIGAMSAVFATSGTASADPAGCKALEIIAIPGTWETGPDNEPVGAGMLGAVTAGMPSSRVDVNYIEYVATAFPWESQIYGASKAEAIVRAEVMMGTIAAQCPASQFAIIGYSQGADAAGDLAARIGHGQAVVGAERVAGLVMASLISSSVKNVDNLWMQIIRGAVCRELAGTDAAYTAGLLSALFYESGIPARKLAQQARISPAVAAAITNGEGQLGQVLTAVIAYEHGDEVAIAATGLDVETVTLAYLKAIPWALSTVISTVSAA